MPSRRKPTSTRQKKVDQQLKRAVKRGDVPPPDPKKVTHNRKPKIYSLGPSGSLIGSSVDRSAAATIQAARRLQSAFVTLPPKFLEETKNLASTLPLPRPVPAKAAVYVGISEDAADQDKMDLSCPRRPKWRFDMTKKEVEHNEESVFKQWLDQIDGLVLKWQNHGNTEVKERKAEEMLAMPQSPTYFERNLEVWRQLWRVTEISQIILVLLDSRCPLLHYPPSLSAYLSDRKVILVLTKVDISGPTHAEAWSEYFHKTYPLLRVVQVESYVGKEKTTEHQGKQQFTPHLPDTFRKRLVDAIKEVHATMLEPPDRIKSNSTWLKKWKPPVKRDINWELVLKGGSEAGSVVDGSALPRSKGDEFTETPEDQEPDFLTIGLIGQPNVGKSSLLNALFGTHKVRASKTPGKTKHFQTLFWTPDVRLVDCPGLVMPNFVPMEMQVLCGILPISRVAAIPSCIYHASQFLPLERIYKLTHPILSLPSVEDKRTWRDGMKLDSAEEKQTAVAWTAMDILVAYADAKGWVTAKAGRPDIHRAGNAILRNLAEAKVGWAFWPPGIDMDKLATATEDGTGIWIPTYSILEEESDKESSTEEEENPEATKDTNEKKDLIFYTSSDDAEEEEENMDVGVGRFGALAMEDVGEDEDESDEVMD